MFSVMAANVKHATRSWRNLRSANYFRLPEKLKGGRVEKWGKFWQTVMTDYKEVVTDSYSDCKERPLKAAIIFTSLGLGYLALKSNPTEQSFRDRFILSSNRFMLASESIQNPNVGEYLNNLSRYYNEGLIRYFSFGLFSIVWVDNYDKQCDIYPAHCNYTKPQYLNFYTRIIDVGLLDQWYMMKRNMVDYDVNPNEWKDVKMEETLFDNLKLLIAYLMSNFQQSTSS